MMLLRPVWPSLILLVLAMAAAPARACDTPVFRVAMFDDRWSPKLYKFCLLRDRQLPEYEQKLLDGFDALLARHQGHVNGVLEVRHPGKLEVGQLRELLQARRMPVMPHLVVQHPPENRISSNVWAGPWRDAPLQALLESPARAAISKRLLAGETGVWVLIESGNQEKDDAAFGRLSKELKHLAATLGLPEPGPGGKKIKTPQGAPPARIAFSVLRLSRSNEAERLFVGMLLGLEEDLDRYASEPIAFAIFGRGAALQPLIGKGITPANIGNDVRYLIGPCICEEKELNPIKDLLMIADWETGSQLPNLTGFFPQTPVVAPPVKQETLSGPLPQPVPPVSPPSQTVPDSPTNTAPGYAGRDGWLLQSVGVGLGIGLAVVIGAGLVVVVRKKRF
jgi:hypothetical protein